jgi:TadE-like protein
MKKQVMNWINTHRRSGLRQPQAGQAMVEFMLIIVFVFVVFLSMMQVVFLMHAYNTLADAAKMGVRYAVVHGTGLCGTAASCACSGPGTVASARPTVACTDSNGTNVVQAVVGLNSTCMPSAGVPQPCGFANLSLQNISTTNNGCGAATANSVNVCYDPGSANTSNPVFGAACSQPGCLIRVTVSHTYAPLFNFSWPSFTLNAAANGRIAN